MSSTEKTISGLIQRQLPDFIRADHPKFQVFLEKYYKWLESNGTFTYANTSYNYGNTVYHMQNMEKYRDIDETRDEFVRYFKQELLPYFPENTSLDLVKILKGAREFYVKKGSEESVKWLFRVLFDEDIEIIYPKKQILIASDGKWKRPQAFQLTVSAANEGIDVNLLEKHMGTGSESKATCIIESANMTVDKVFGYEILEIYVSNVTREFINGENLEIPYTDENGVAQTFSEKIIGSISNIVINSSKRGEKYNVGDPVVVVGGLDTTNQANDAVAIVGNVTVGSIESVAVGYAGFGYRVYSNTEAIVYAGPTDFAGANQSTDIRVTAIDTLTFGESINVEVIPSAWLEDTTLDSASYTVFTENVRNIVINATETDKDDVYFNREPVWANGASYATANFKGYIVTSNSSGFGQGGGSAYTGSLMLYAVANSVSLSATGFLVGQSLYGANSDKVFTVNSITSSQIPANIDSKIFQTMNTETLVTGGIALFDVVNGGYGFRSPPTIEVSSYFDTAAAAVYDYDTEYASKKQWRQPMGVYGHIARVVVLNPGTGYSNGDAITVTGRGYDFAGYVNVNAAGSIIFTTITNRGEGYYGTRSATVSGAGSNAAVVAYGFGEGETHSVQSGSIGRISDFRMLSRGYDYVSTPVVSLKVVDMIITGVGEGDSFTESEFVYQGASLETASFAGRVKSYNSSTGLLRLYNYSGNSGINFNATLPFTSEDGVTFTVDTASKIEPPAALLGLGELGDPYSAIRASGGLPNPWFYGDGKARANAEFYNGLIKYPGFYLNTDGFLSADKRLQDSQKYHNYSYVIQSGKSLADYKAPVTDIVHPIGMSMLGETIALSDIDDVIMGEGVAYVNGINPAGSGVKVASSLANVVTGYSTDFQNPTYAANVGDIFIITDANNPLRSQAKVISAVNSDTELEVEGNFTYIGQGKISVRNGLATANISANTNAIGQFIQANDKIKLNIAGGGQYVAQTGTVQVFTANGKVVGSSTSFDTELAVNSIVKINNQIRKVVNIASATVMNVNASFTSAASGLSINKLATVVHANVISISGNVLTTNVTFGTNANGMVYVVMPVYSDVEYDYDILTTVKDVY